MRSPHGRFYKMKYLGIDACKGGWFMVGLDKNYNANFGLFNNISSVFEKFRNISLALIDIPIGLPYIGFRRCDALAKKYLGKRSSSIFTVPIREAVFAGSYELACKLNFSVNGKKLSKQVWNITPKIKEVDSFLRNNPGLIPRVRESHPEVCFKSICESSEIRFSKRKREGRLERIAVLCDLFEETQRIYDESLNKYKRKDLSPDDVLDSIVLALSASPLTGELRSIPDTPETDSHGLYMKISF